MKSLIACVVFVVVFLVPCTLRAQGTTIGGGVGFPLHLPDISSYQTSFVPLFLYGMQGTGKGTQTLTLERSIRPSLWGALEWLPAAHGGLLVRGVFQRTPVSGINTPYHVTVDYLASQPPDNVAQQYHYERSTPWPATTGHLDTWSFDVQATVATSSNSRARVHADGGLTVIGISGSFEPAGFTTFQLGGHAVLFPSEYQLILGPSRTWTAAGVASGGVTIQIGPSAGIDVSARAVLPRTVSVDLKVLSVGVDTAITELSTEDAQRALAPAPLQVRLGTFELLIGIRVGL
ncbi:MAG: hypothetical protein ACM36C_00765 [Acidobacteriota bacterium]